MTPRIDATALLKEAREAAGLSQRELADRAGTAQSVVARIELGQASPTVRTLNRLLDAAGASPEVVLRSGRPRDASPGASREPDAGRLRKRDEVAERLKEYLRSAALRGIVSVYLFGSIARGSGHSESDVDVAVLLDRRSHPERASRGEARIRITADLIRALTFDNVDVVILNDAPPELAARIVLDGLCVFRGDPEADHRFVRDTLLRWGDLAPFLRRMRRIKLEALAR